MSRYIKIGEAARLLGITVQTLRRWEHKGELLPDRKSEGGTRYYDIDKLIGLRNIETDLTIGYARVSSRDQKDDLKRQAQRLELYCTAKGWRFEIIQDLGSGMNYRKRGLKRLLDLIINRQIKRCLPSPLPIKSGLTRRANKPTTFSKHVAWPALPGIGPLASGKSNMKPATNQMVLT